MAALDGPQMAALGSCGQQPARSMSRELFKSDSRCDRALHGHSNYYYPVIAWLIWEDRRIRINHFSLLLCFMFKHCSSIIRGVC